MYPKGRIIEGNASLYLRESALPVGGVPRFGNGDILGLDQDTEISIIEGVLTFHDKSYFKVQFGKAQGYVLASRVAVVGPKVISSPHSEVFEIESVRRVKVTDLTVPYGTPVQVRSGLEKYQALDEKVEAYLRVRFWIDGEPEEGYMRASSVNHHES